MLFKCIFIFRLYEINFWININNKTTCNKVKILMNFNYINFEDELDSNQSRFNQVLNKRSSS